MKLEDGTGSGNEAKIDSNKRLHTQSVTESEAVHSTEIGESYNVVSGTVSLSAAGTLLYIKNNELQEIVVEKIIIHTGAASISDSCEITLIRNPTAGDLISDATAVSINQNRNYGSSNSLDVDDFKGKSGGTITGGSDFEFFYIEPTTTLSEEIDIVIPKGDSIAVKFDPKLSSGSLKVTVSIELHLKDVASKD